MFKVLDPVVLTHDLPEVDLRRGDLGAIVDVSGPNTFEVEFVAASGRTQAPITLSPIDIRNIRDQDLIAVRTLEPATG